MDPLSRKKRTFYFVILFFIFIIFAPLFILDARGYAFNFKDVIKISQTGGLYIDTDQSGLEIYVNGKLEKKTSIVQKSVFVQDLKPGIYEIIVSKKGLQTWSKTLKVFPEIVTDTRPFLLKSEPELIEISRYLDDGVATSSKSSPLKNPDYDFVNTVFLSTTSPKTSTTSKNATTSIDNKTISDVFVKNINGELQVLWKGDIDSMPSYFCESSICKQEIIIKTNSRIKFFDFFPGRNDLLIVQMDSGIYVSEIDDRSLQNIQKIIEGAGYEFRVKDGNEIYLKKGTNLYLVSI